MSCINKYDFSYFDRIGQKHTLSVDCGHCVNCMIKKQSALEFLAKKELLSKYLNNQGASFVTLTYDDTHLPKNELGLVTLKRRDVQLFIKKMRRNMEYHNKKIPFKYIYCGELGSEGARPHYHIIFIGLTEYQVKQYTKKLWDKGLCDIGVLAQGGIRYVLKYMTKALPPKDVKELRENLNVQNPFVYHSVGLGKEWILQNMDKIVEDGFSFNINGKKQLFPKYIMRFVSAHTGIDYIPYVKKFIKEEVLSLAKARHISYQQYDFENSYIRYKTNIAVMRQKGIPVTDETLSKKWVKPNHSLDRCINVENLVGKALSIASKNIEISLEDKEKHKIFGCRNFDGSINWDKYFNICDIRNTIPF